MRGDGAVRLALAWSCWATYLGRPESDRYRLQAIGLLGNALFECSEEREQAVLVQESYLASIQRCAPHDEEAIIGGLSNLAGCLDELGRHDEALFLLQEAYARRVSLSGAADETSLVSGCDVWATLHKLGRVSEACAFCREQLPLARIALGDAHPLTLRIGDRLSDALLVEGATEDDLLEAEAILGASFETRRRVLGPAHPATKKCKRILDSVKLALA